MRTILLTGLASLLAVGLAQENALAMGGQGGPSDAWGSPYALYAPQTFKAPAGWGSMEGRSVYEGQDAAPIDCHGDRACEWRMRQRMRAAPAQ